MIKHISRTGVWDIKAEDTELPTLKLDALTAGQVLKVTCQFYGRTMTDDLADGFSFRVEEEGTNLITLTPDLGLVQGSDSWQLLTHHVLFEVTDLADGEPCAIHVALGKGDMNGEGAMMNFVLFAESIS